MINKLIVCGYIVFNIYALFFMDYGILIKIANILNVAIFGILSYRAESHNKIIEERE